MAVETSRMGSPLMQRLLEALRQNFGEIVSLVPETLAEHSIFDREHPEAVAVLEFKKDGKQWRLPVAELRLFPERMLIVPIERPGYVSLPALPTGFTDAQVVAYPLSEVYGRVNRLVDGLTRRAPEPPPPGFGVVLFDENLP